MKQTIINEVLTCDYCQSSMISNYNKVELVTGKIGQGTDWHVCTAIISITGIIPYSTSNADICINCAIKFLQEANDKLCELKNDLL